MSQEVEVSNFEFIRQVYRGSSPTVTRQENRIKELEELLDLEREARKRLERTNLDLEDQLDSVVNQVDECSLSANHQNEALRRRDADILRLRKELDKMGLAMDTSEQELRKKNHLALMDLKTEVENLQNLRLKNEKDKMVLLKELEATLVSLDSSHKSKATLESRAENAESQLARLRATSEDQERQLKELVSLRSALGEELNSSKTSLKDANQQNLALRKSKTSLETQLDESRKSLEEEVRQKEILQSQSHQLHQDNEHMKTLVEESSETEHRVNLTLSRVQSELAQVRAKYEKEVEERVAEMDDLRRKNCARIHELSEEASREHVKNTSLEKARQQLALEVSGLSADLERAESEAENLHHEVRALEARNKDLDSELQEVSIEASQVKMAQAKTALENSRLRSTLEEEEQRVLALSRENGVLSGQVRDLKERMHSLAKEAADAGSAKAQLEAERENLLATLDETKEMLLDSERKAQNCHNLLLQLKTEMEQRLQEKQEELEALRKASSRTVEELSARLQELETRYKTDVTKTKKKYESQIKELQEGLDEVQKENTELSEELQETSHRLQEVEKALEEERQESHLVQEKLSSSERRRVQLQGDLDDSNRLLEAADKSRKNVQVEIEEMSLRFADCSAQTNSLANERRKLENEVATLRLDLDDLALSKIESEERANRCCNQVSVLMDDLKQEQESHKKNESIKKALAQELKEVKAKLEHKESSSTKEMAKNTQMFQERVRDLELELEAERTKNKEGQIQARKQERMMKEFQKQVDDERNVVAELQMLLDGAQMKVKTFKRQVDELEATNMDSLNKYRRARKEAEDAEHRVAVAERRSVSLIQGSVMTTSSYSSRVVGTH